MQENEKKIEIDLTDEQYVIFDKIIKVLQARSLRYLDKVLEQDSSITKLNLNEKIYDIVKYDEGKKFMICNLIIQTLITAPAFAMSIDSFFESESLTDEFIDNYVLIQNEETKRFELFDKSKYEWY